MVKLGKIWYTKNGTPCPTYEEAICKERLETRDAFMRRCVMIIKERDESNNYHWIKDSAQCLFEHPAVFIQAMKEFGLFPKEG